MTTKQRVTITLDADLYNLAKLKYNNLSGRINDLISIDLHESDEKSKLVKKLNDLKKEEKIVTKKICELEKKEVLIAGDDKNINEVIDWALSIYKRRGVIGLNILEKECKNRKVNFENIKSILEREDVAFVNFDG